MSGTSVRGGRDWENGGKAASSGPFGTDPKAPVDVSKRKRRLDLRIQIPKTQQLPGTNPCAAVCDVTD